MIVFFLIKEINHYSLNGCFIMISHRQPLISINALHKSIDLCLSSSLNDERLTKVLLKVKRNFLESAE
jgi:hypothetical protein